MSNREDGAARTRKRASTKGLSDPDVPSVRLAFLSPNRTKVYPDHFLVCRASRASGVDRYGLTRVDDFIVRPFRHSGAADRDIRMRPWGTR